MRAWIENWAKALQPSTLHGGLRGPGHRAKEWCGDQDDDAGYDDREPRRRPELPEPGEQPIDQDDHCCNQHDPGNGTPLPALTEEDSQQGQAARTTIDRPHRRWGGLGSSCSGAEGREPDCEAKEG